MNTLQKTWNEVQKICESSEVQGYASQLIALEAGGIYIDRDSNGELRARSSDEVTVNRKPRFERLSGNSILQVHLEPGTAQKPEARVFIVHSPVGTLN